MSDRYAPGPLPAQRRFSWPSDRADTKSPIFYCVATPTRPSPSGRRVAPIADMNNYLLSLWLITLGVLLLRWRAKLPATT